jgi:hypothetical protein
MKRLLPERPRLTNETILGGLKRIARRMPCYGHVKTFVYIDREGMITVDADVAPWPAHAVARAIATRGKSFLEGITDHLISNYIRALQGDVRPKHPEPRRRVWGGMGDSPMSASKKHGRVARATKRQ